MKDSIALKGAMLAGKFVKGASGGGEFRLTTSGQSLATRFASRKALFVDERDAQTRAS
jgi:hypothetical protein